MSNQLQITGGAKVRNLEGVLTGTSGVVSSVPLGAANGVATLDSGGKVPVSQLPSSVVTYLGTWNAATNTPTLTNGVGDAGDMYICNVAGTVNFGAGPITFAVGDWVLYGSGTWQKSSGQNGTVTSVGASITGNAIGLTGSPITTAGTLAFAFAGTAAQYINGAGNLVTFPTTIAQAQRLITEVYNETGSTLTKGTVVYINGGHGNLPTVTKAIATGDATSAQTYGVVQNDITDNNNGYVVVIGSLGDLDTQAYPNGTQLYLSSTTAGAWTSTKQYAPAHLVYVGIVVRSHPTQGVVEVRIQNGFELDELHNVSAQTPTNNQGLFYNSSTSLWENKSIATALGYTPANDALVVHLAGTETITGIKTFSNGLNTDYIGITGDMTMDGSFLLKHVAYGTLQSGYTNLSGQTNGLRVGLFGGYNALLNFSTSGSYTYTFPNATGTIALTSDIPSLAGYVTLATTQTITGAKTFNSGTKFDLGLFLKESSSSGRLSGYVGISATATGGMQQLQFLYPVSGSSVFSLPTTGSFNYEFPAASGTVALLEFSQTFSGLQSFTNTAGTDLTYGAYLTKNSIPSFSSSLTVNLYSASGNNNLVVRDNGNTSKLQFQATSSYTYTFPALTGTLALTSDISYPVTSVFGRTGAVVATEGDYSLTQLSDVTITTPSSGQVLRYNGTSWENSTESYVGTVTSVGLSAPTGFSVSGSPVTSSGTLTLSFAAGYSLPTNASQTNWDTAYTNRITSATAPLSITSNVISISQATTSTNGYLSSTDWNTFNGKQTALNGTGFVKISGTTISYDNSTYLTTSAAASTYLPLTGGVLTGNLTMGSTTAGKNLIAYASSYGNTGLVRLYGTDGLEKLQLGSFADGGYVYSSGTLYLYNGGSNTFTLTGTTAQITNGNNLEVGYSAVQNLYKLDVNGTGRFSGALTYPKFIMSGGSDQSELTNSVNNDFKLTNSGNFRIINNSNTVALLTIANSGAATFSSSVTATQIGANTSTFAASVFKLQVGDGTTDSRAYFNTSNPYALAVANSSSNAYYLGVATSGTTSSFQIFNAGASTTPLTITNGGNVLIGDTTDYSYKLYVNGGSSNGMLFYSTSAANQIKAAGTAPAITFSNTITSPTIGGSLGLVTAANQFLTGTAAGDMILINQFTGNKLYITNYSGGVYLTQGATSWTANSDIRLKNINSYIENAVEKLSTLQTINFSYKDDKTNKQNLGLIAQEVEKIFPELIDKNGDGMLGVRYTELVPVLIKAVQELKLEIETLKNK